MLKLIKNDPWLSPYSHAIEGRHNYAVWREKQLTGGKCELSDFAQGHKYYGLHKEDKGWVFREWAPTATDIFLVGDFNDWQEQDAYRLQR
ncbi:MAG: 1,4-alpha-glucan-branching enzyme, partial [Bacteroidaceae bacterium]